MDQRSTTILEPDGVSARVFAGFNIMPDDANVGVALNICKTLYGCQFVRVYLVMFEVPPVATFGDGRTTDDKAVSCAPRIAEIGTKTATP